MFAGSLRQSTEATILIGQFVDATDGVTAETGLATEIQTTTALMIDSGSGITTSVLASVAHQIGGYYRGILSTSDTSFSGLVTVVYLGTSAKHVRQTYQVLPANVYDALFGSSGDLGTNIASILEDTGTTLPALLPELFTPTNVLQHEVAEGFIFRLTSRRDGTFVARNTLYLSSQSERPRFAFDMANITKSKPSQITSVIVLDSAGSMSADMTVADEGDTAICGVRDWLLLSKVTGCTNADTFTVRATVVAEDSSTYVLEGDIVTPN